jgi:DNA-binding winged helix-turn-helix (wHTH) protein/TolB-like protein/Tfp pilus assembly protein PilF
MDVLLHEEGVFSFESFRLDPIRRTLTRTGQPIPLRQLLFEALHYLAQHHGRVVGREELTAAVWGGRVVDENNLGQAISALRRALRDAGATGEIIVTVPGRGYKLAAAVTFEPVPPSVAQVESTPAPVLAPAVAPPRGRRLIAAAAALLVVSAAAAAYLWRQSPGSAEFAPPPHSVAVLTFANAGGDPAQAYLADGLADEVTDRLSRIGALHVSARTSALSFKGSHATAGEIARRLNVRTVLEGSVRRTDTGVHVSVSLIDGGTGYRIWEDTRDVSTADSTHLAGDLAAAVTAALNVTPNAQEGAQLTLGGTDNPAAMDHYLHGLTVAIGGGPEALRPALTSFEAAVAADPAYALAHLYRGVALEQLADWETGHDQAWIDETQAEAEGEVRRAIALAPNLGAAHAALAEMLEKNHVDFAGALAEMDYALLLSPGDSQTKMTYAFLQVHVGRFQSGIAAAREAAVLDPLSPRIYRELSNVLIESRQFEAANVALQHARQSEPAETMNDRIYAAQIEIGLGHPDKVVQLCTGLQNHEMLEYCAIAQHALGHDEDAQRALDAMQKSLGDPGALNYAEVCAQWGRTAEALAWLKTAVRLHDTGLPYLRASPLLDPIASTSDFKEIDRQLNFPPSAPVP